MVHSVELVFDPDTETTVRSIWDALHEHGIRAPSPGARPHTTAIVADRIDAEVLTALAGLAGRFPLRVRIGAALVFGRSAGILARLVVPSTELLDLHREVARLAAAYLRPGPLPHTLPGDWTPHVTLARRVEPAQLATALHITGRPAEIEATAIGLRLWDSATRTERFVEF
ncbi:uncharacterized protein RMCC_3114 [Mycolicibacterium canariasense]|uniref:2'-5' RNA ligase n=1 Tax=Mycolicibacterium canariasense TaxID=228230 RepID=A0A100WDQ4_MYCCR|nr:2'-5' RNA ligase family protein [Mycolicibacterium canariasense]MCV7207785.1 2'-5' RNA ligase family protein [Mycolicibacterium canariasense]ORV04846.1 hypothetical protein AWB94_21105 [Mycolicibacterium canariasense]GAS96148.1 uncharacterized protein RMCC_3114 [Mycolicibacterium canariasense]